MTSGTSSETRPRLRCRNGCDALRHGRWTVCQRCRIKICQRSAKRGWQFRKKMAQNAL